MAQTLMRRAYMLGVLGLAACSRTTPDTTLKSSQTMEKFTLTRTNLGQKDWTLQAASADLREEGGNIDLSAPRIQILHADRPATQATAETGVFIQKNQDIRLSSHVIVVTHDSEDHAATTLRTEILDYSSAEKKFKTDQPVQVKRPGSVMKGVGMIANEDLSEIRILRQETTFQ